MKKCLLTLITIIIILSLGCQKMEIVTENKEVCHKDLKVQQFKIENGIICFENEKEMQKTIQYLLSLSDKEYKNWCRQNNFVSLQLLYTDAVNQQADYIENFEQQNQKEITKSSIEYCPTLQLLIDKGIIIADKNDFRLNIKEPHWAYILNENYCIKIENKIHKFYNDKIIVDSSKVLQYDYPAEYYYCKDKEFFFDDNKRKVKLTTAAYLSKALYSNDYQLYFYSTQKLFKNNNPNSGYFHLLPQTNYIVRYTDMYGNNQNFFDNPIPPSGVWSEKTSVYQHFYIKGQYGQNINYVIHMPHIKTAFLSFHILDKYFLGSSELYYDFSILNEIFLLK